mgnify:FL=1|tara:strand:- start:4053 stop:4304 length:252 start_codon:yes stop_codon:yes gene_type:complete
MINLEEKYGSYIGSNKTFRIDGVNEPVTGYGYHCDGSDIKGYWVNTTHFKLFYNLNEQFLRMEPLNDVESSPLISKSPSTIEN